MKTYPITFNELGFTLYKKVYNAISPNQQGIPEIIKIWREKFNVNIRYNRQRDVYIFYFQSKAAYMLFLLEWS